MIRMSWIELSIVDGNGMLTLKRVEKRPEMEASMSWRGELTITGAAHSTVEGALELLEHALRDDAAAEMLKKGQV